MIHKFKIGQFYFISSIKGSSTASSTSSRGDFKRASMQRGDISSEAAFPCVRTGTVIVTIAWGYSPPPPFGDSFAISKCERRGPRTETGTLTCDPWTLRPFGLGCDTRHLRVLQPGRLFGRLRTRNSTFLLGRRRSAIFSK